MCFLFLFFDDTGVQILIRFIPVPSKILLCITMKKLPQCGLECQGEKEQPPAYELSVARTTKLLRHLAKMS